MWGRERVDRLEERCKALLEPGEQIVLEAEAGGWVSPTGEIGWGRIFLTNARLLWVQRGRWFVWKLGSWVPDVLVLRLSDVDRVSLSKTFLATHLTINANGRQYIVRLARDFFLIRATCRSAQQWLAAIEEIRRTENRTERNGVIPREPRESGTGLKTVGLLWTAFVLAMTPVWIVGFVLSEQASVLFLALGVLTAIGLATGLLMISAGNGGPPGAET